jgi:hypothetical protein
MSIPTAVGSETSGALTGHPETALGSCNYERLGRAEQSIDPSPILPKIWRIRDHRVDFESAELLIQDTTESLDFRFPFHVSSRLS